MSQCTPLTPWTDPTELLQLAAVQVGVPTNHGRRDSLECLIFCVGFLFGELVLFGGVQVAEERARSVLGWPQLRSFQRRAVEAWAAGRHCFDLY